MASILFEPITINTIELRNRFVMSAAADNLSGEDGEVTDAQVARYRELAEGGVGLIISGGITVHPTGTSHPGSPALANDAAVSGWKTLTTAVHGRGGKIAAQLVHSGIWTSRYQNSLGRDGIAPSVLPPDCYYLNRGWMTAGRYRAATDDDLTVIITAFGAAARRAKEAGFDAVQFHGAHDSLLSQFLSPHTNRRTDRWGRSPENRLRLHRELYRSVRERVGAEYPVMIKLGVEDGFSGGLTFAEGKAAAAALGGLGVDAIEVSLGLQGELFAGTVLRTGINTISKEAYYRNWSREIKKTVALPIMLVGGLRSFELIEEIVRNGEADLASLCRPLVREPGLIGDWESGDRHRATCVSCNLCVKAIGEGKPLACYLDTAE
ncbi:MAG: NADH:flavin oxidoreductase [PVC group bacterium]